MITVFVENVPLFNIEVTKSTKIKDIKQLLSEKYKNYSIQMFLNSKTELKVFSSNEWNDFSFETVFDKFKNPSIYLTKNKYGNIRIGQTEKYKSYPSYENYEIIPAWSRGKGEWKLLSPFYLKTDQGEIFENFYQSFKVWKTVNKQNTKNWKWPAETHVDEEGNPNEKWFIWNESLKNHELPVRRPNGKLVPLYAYFNGNKLDVIEGRKQIYISFLKDIYRKHPVYKKLLENVKSGKNIMIVEPDGPLLDAYPDGLEMNLPLLNKLIDVTNYKEEGFPERYRPYGHGYVLAMTLLEDLNN